MSIELIRYNAACRAIAEAATLEEVKDYVDRAEAYKDYARRAEKRELEVIAGDLRYRAERRYGELLILMKESGKLAEGRPPKPSTGVDSYRVTLKEIRTTPNFSSKCQRLAKVAADQFERKLAEWRASLLADKDERSELMQKQKADRRRQREAELGAKICALPTKKYGVIIADPEWQFQAWSRETGMDRATENHYPTSPTEVIASRKVGSIAADDCVLGLWATTPMLQAALVVMDGWGFQYKTHWVWAKDRIGMGFWNRSRHELFLLGTRGEVPCPAPGEQWESVIEAPRRGHSEKPEVFLEMIEAYFPSLPKIELNRRGPARPGWSSWGNEAEG